VRDDGDNGFELVAGFHRIAAARSVGLAEVPVLLRDARTEDAGRAVEKVTSCQHRHEVINADVAVMPTCVATLPSLTANRLARWA
jgi:ParB-like nuclease domain